METDEARFEGNIDETLSKDVMAQTGTNQHGKEPHIRGVQDSEALASRLGAGGLPQAVAMAGAYQHGTSREVISSTLAWTENKVI